MDVIAVNHLNFTYGDGDDPVLQDVTFALPEGSFCVLLGQNGAGKSTLLKLLLGELTPQENQGEIRLFGQEIRQFKDWPRLSFVRQNGISSYENFPATALEIVRANLYARLGLFRFNGRRQNSQAMEALREVGMEEYAGRLIGRLSGGQQQRILLARALVQQPQLLILDEPTSAMDEAARSAFCRLLSEINRKRGVSVLMVTHDRRTAEPFADRILALEDGRIREEVRRDGNL